ncbi:hypothetical protein QBC46DRAFT_408458 [Diplogelasinospora grovesii]|uniref:Uncharacterized protein n=1 Tax=Diplogelasinospora grovesii TaxID=303347 RepID=A0AAN6N6P4_9PEZI|nr:hypothetical protein QBC46DRAFT_408458 [Diplogelasinospora grovesii]
MGSIEPQGPVEVDLSVVRSKSDPIDTAILEAESLGDGAFYWWRTSGQDLSRMLVEAGYPEECRRQFLDFYRDTICPLLGGRPEPSSRPTCAGWDGNPFVGIGRKENSSGPTLQVYVTPELYETPRYYVDSSERVM